MQSFQNALTGPAKLEAVKDLVNKLTLDLEEHNLTERDRNDSLENLKVYGRDPQNSDPIFSREGIKTLARHAFDSPSATTSQNALRCLANAMFLRPECRQMFADLGYGPKACDKLKNDSRDDEFLVSRALFLSIYSLDFNKLLDDCDLAGTLVKNLARHCASPPQQGGCSDPMAATALAETANLLFTVTSRFPSHRGLFTGAIGSLASLLVLTPSNRQKPLDPPVGSIVNAMSDLDLASPSAQESLFPKDNPSAVAARLLDLLEQSTAAYKDFELEVKASPLVMVLIALYAQASDSTREEMRAGILPTESDREGVLGRGNSPSARLLQNTTNPLAPNLSQLISQLLFDLSDRNATQFVENVGYGFASGFLIREGIPVPPSATASASSGGRVVNPITGQLIDMEAASELPEMTDEEKEREAERLFVLFERLRRTGVINVQNPVEQALRDGRLQELGDDADDVD